MDEAFLTTAEAALRLEVSPGRVRQFISSGRLAAHKFGRDWIIPESVLVEFSKIERKAGNPNFRRGKKYQAPRLEQLSCDDTPS